MNLKEHYDTLYNESLEIIKRNNFSVDELIDSKTDERYGVTLLLRPSISVKNEIQKFLDELKKVEPTQYYYRNSDIHITVLSIISCYTGFKLDQIDISSYEEIISKSIDGIKSFEINFIGITASPSGIMIQGFLKNDNLNSIRNNLRENFRDSNLEESIDKRYSLQTAHSTVVRFRKEVKNSNDFLNILEKYRNYNFGTFNVDTLEFVGNDWYQKKERVVSLKKFKLED